MREGKRVEALIELHRAFLKLEDFGRPLFGVRRSADHRPPPFLVKSVGEGSLLEPNQLHTQLFLDWYETFLEEDAIIPDDTFHPAKPFFAIPWMEAVLGCPVYVHPTSLYTEPILESWDRLYQVNFSLDDNAWFGKLLEMTTAFVERFDLRFPLCTTLLRGPGDMAAAVRGREELCLDLFDHPQQVKDLMARCASLWIEATKEQLEIIPPYAGGYFNRMHVWTPGTTSTPHIDFSSLISRQMFQEFLLPYEQKLVGAFDFPIYHCHSTSLHVVDDLRRMANVAAIQLTVEETGPSLAEIIPVLAGVQREKAVILIGRFEKLELVELAEGLSTRGLCLIFMVENADEAQESIARAHEIYSHT